MYKMKLGMIATFLLAVVVTIAPVHVVPNKIDFPVLCFAVVKAVLEESWKKE